MKRFTPPITDVLNLLIKSKYPMRKPPMLAITDRDIKYPYL